MARRRTHKDVEFAVDDASGRARIFKTFDARGARWLGGDDAVEVYKEDPEASVFERHQIKVNSIGRVP